MLALLSSFIQAQCDRTISNMDWGKAERTGDAGSVRPLTTACEAILVRDSTNILIKEIVSSILGKSESNSERGSGEQGTYRCEA